ncbi:MAG TPA: PEPxxWA-CTERM sorting domain-containing protein, partial [Candidatus Methylacidiphilales bacterium]
NAAVAGDVGSDPVNSGNELAVGNTAIQFGTDANSVLLTLNLQNGNVASTTPYVLIAGTLVGDSAATSQYANLTLGTSTGSLATGLMTQILNTSGSGPLTVNFGNVSGSAYANSELFLYQDSTTGVDDIVLELVPEPSTWALMLGGMGVLAFCLRRKNQRA